MEYCEPVGNISNINKVKYIGYESNDCERILFGVKNTKLISDKLTELLQGVDPQGRNIVIPDATIHSVMSNIYTNFVPRNIGGIYTKYIIPNCDVPPGYQDIIDQTIEVIVSDVKNNIGITQNNMRLSIWSTVGGDFNPYGLRHHAPIKLNHKKPMSTISTRY